MDHWPEHARRWALVGPPLRPSADDLAVVASRIAGARRAVILGVTPELVALPWPEPRAVVAVERVRGVIAALHGGGAPAIAADWRALPLARGAFDLAVGDGVLSLMPFPDGYRALARELARVLAPGGRAILRVFAAPEVRVALAAVEPGDSFHALKWRVAMALGESVAVADLLAAFDARFPDRAALAARTGWPRAVIDGIDVYRGSPAVYSFPTLARALAALAPELVAVETVVADDELRCPTVVLRRA